MTNRFAHIKRYNASVAPTPGVVLGLRVKHDILRRIAELEARFKPSHGDLRELARLKEMMRLIASSPGEQQ